MNSSTNKKVLSLCRFGFLTLAGAGALGLTELVTMVSLVIGYFHFQTNWPQASVNQKGETALAPAFAMPVQPGARPRIQA
jgi:hypothetical protein